MNTVVLNPNQAELISGDQNGYIKIWDLDADICREEYLPLTDVPIRSISIVRISLLYDVICYLIYSLSCNLIPYNMMDGNVIFELLSGLIWMNLNSIIFTLLLLYQL